MFNPKYLFDQRSFHTCCIHLKTSFQEPTIVSSIFRKKKYPLIISDERVSLRHINLMTLGRRSFFRAADRGSSSGNISMRYCPVDRLAKVEPG